ncbi:MAG: murein L,D-transpeptidase catalytic domain family protein [Gemmatimonadetes bacterium]|nr:murein L,D-transpeptidase catalytic domain family protein [Gemmatimonadota bacterium]
MRPHLLKLYAVAAVFLGLNGTLLSEAGDLHASQPARAYAAPGGPGSAAPLPLAIRLRVASFVPATIAAEAGSRGILVVGALTALAGQVTRKSDPAALRLAFQAYYNYRAAHPGEVRNPYLYFVDYGLDSRTPRGYVFDMDALKVVEGPFTVAHGRGSDAPDGVPERFSNESGSYMSSLGLFLTREVYAFTGSSGGGSYRSIGLRMSGVSGAFNSAAYDRAVVVHGAPYVTPDGAGRSEGCPAMEPDRAERLIPLIGNGGMVFLFSPNDPAWLRQDPWAHGLTGLRTK